MDKGYNDYMKKSKQKRDFWIYLGIGLFVLFLISILAVNLNTTKRANDIPDNNNQTKETTQFEKNQPTSAEPNKTDPPKEEDSTKENTMTESEVPSQPAAQEKPATPAPTPTCYHEEAGRCWDDLEDEAYSAGQYDRAYGYYGATLEYAENCDALCRDIIEDAYDEGWYDF